MCISEGMLLSSFFLFFVVVHSGISEVCPAEKEWPWDQKSKENKCGLRQPYLKLLLAVMDCRTVHDRTLTAGTTLRWSKWVQKTGGWIEKFCLFESDKGAIKQKSNPRKSSSAFQYLNLLKKTRNALHGVEVVVTVASQREGSRFNSRLGPFRVESACSPRVCVASLRVLRLPPTVQTHAR